MVENGFIRGMVVYKIELITDKIGNEKIYDMYSVWKGSVLSRIHMHGIGNYCYLEYIKEGSGYNDDGYVITSNVEQITVDGLNYHIPNQHINVTKGMKVTIHTMNSIYHMIKDEINVA